MREILPFILCGGAGTRLWPLSREAFTKQFRRLTGLDTLFQETCRRLSGPLFGDLSVLANHRHRFLIAEQLEAMGVPAKNIVLEPVSRNTAPSACVAALIAWRKDPEALVQLAPSDHRITDGEVFRRAAKAGVPAALDGALVVFGITSDCPHTGYGYVEIEAEEVVTCKGEALRGKTVAANGGTLFRRWRLLLEFGHFPVQGQDHANPLRDARAADLRGLP